MGAAARQRGDKVIRDQAKPEMITVSSEYVSRLEVAVNNLIIDKRKLQNDIKKSRLKIERLRAENSVLKAEKELFFETVRETKRHISVSGNTQKKWTVSLVLSRLEKARLI